MKKRILYVDNLFEDKSVLLEHKGEAVWNVDLQEYVLLEQATEQFEFSIINVAGVQSVFNNNESTTTKGIVIALGKEVAELAYLYAFLTKRSCRVVEDIAMLNIDESVEMLITYSAQISDALFEKMYEQKATSVAGLLYANNFDDLRKVVLTKAAIAQFPLRIKAENIIDYSVEHTIDTEEAKSIWQQKNDVLSVSTHSDGLDMFLGGAIMCCMNDLPTNFKEEYAPYCYKNNYCPRLKEAFSTALENGKLIFPSEVKSKLLILQVCWGVLSRKNAIENVWGLGRLWLKNPLIAAVLTSWKIITVNGDEQQLLLDLLNEGKTLGEAVAIYNQLDNIIKQDARLCVLGDATLRWEESNQILYTPDASLVQEAIEELVIDRSYLQEIHFIRSCMLEQISIPKNEKTYELASNIYEYLSLYELHAYKKSSELQKIGDVLRKLVFEYIADGYYVSVRNWDMFNSKTIITSKNDRCFSCDSIAVSRKCVLSIPNIEERFVTICSCCGHVRDVPMSMKEMSFSIEEGKIFVNFDWTKVTTNWLAGIILYHPIKSQRQIALWPKNELTKKPVDYMFIPNHFKGKGHFNVSFFFMEECKQYGVLSTLINEL